MEIEDMVFDEIILCKLNSIAKIIQVLQIGERRHECKEIGWQCSKFIAVEIKSSKLRHCGKRACSKCWKRIEAQVATELWDDHRSISSNHYSVWSKVNVEKTPEAKLVKRFEDNDLYTLMINATLVSMLTNKSALFDVWKCPRLCWWWGSNEVSCSIIRWFTE